MILDLHRQGLSVSAAARRLDLDRKTVRKYIARGVQAPTCGPRDPRPQKIDPYMEFVRSRLQAYPQLSAIRLLREIWPLGFVGGYGLVKQAVRSCARSQSAASSIASRPLPEPRRRWTLRSFALHLLRTRNRLSRCGCSRWCWATAVTSGASSYGTRIC